MPDRVEMRRLAYSDRALKDLDDILTYIAQTSGDYDVAERFVARIIARCAKISASKVQLGRARDELRHELRSVPFGNYVLFIRYQEGTLEIVRVIESHRDIAAQFSDKRSD